MIIILGEVNLMGPLIDAELERVDRRHAQLTQLSADLVAALSLYHNLMREPSFNPLDKMLYSFPPSSTPMVIYGLFNYINTGFFKNNIRYSIIHRKIYFFVVYRISMAVFLQICQCQ